ncbi:MAG: hypothetical protein K2J37_04745 [Ruminococcus sp.]|nr:hypothetical protein [Ruminococcus sp.]MDE6784346.1 hypothetical protein [Ruminococcus sp.]
MKILYCQEEEITLNTKMCKAAIEKNGKSFMITNNKNKIKIVLDNIQYIDLFQQNGIGSMIKLVNGSETETYFLTVPRLFIDIGGGFAIINAMAVKKLYNQLTADL